MTASTPIARVAAFAAAAEHRRPGTIHIVVRFKSGRNPGLYAVVKSDLSTYNVARLGGQEGRYFRSIPASALEHVDAAEVLR